jgi:glycosyltransferase involved in cell wall biosynthesis
MTSYDVAILSDLRYPGGNSASIVAEVRAQAAAGLTTVLIHVPSPHLRHARPFQAEIVACLRDGLADLAHDCFSASSASGASGDDEGDEGDDDEIVASVLLIRQPRIFTEDLARAPSIKAGHTIVVLNQPPGDETDDERYYVFADVRARVERYFGTGVVWAPISSQVRENVLRVAPDTTLPDTDWHEIIDVADWAVERHRTPGAPPVIGRHGRPDPVKWPRDPGELLQAYPDTTELKVRFLGGGEIGVRRLGRRPSSWDVVEFGAESPQEFLGSLDFFVYFHDPDWVEAFGRTILEAMASGVPVIVGPHFRSIFGEAALYSDPAGVRDLVRRLHADRPAYEALVARARAFVASRYGSASHVARLASLGIVALQRPRSPEVAAVTRQARRVLLVGDDVDRFRAIAAHLPPELEPVVVAGSERLPDAHEAGLLTEYLPSASDLGVPAARWTAFVRDRLRHLVSFYGPRAVLVGGLPHDGIMAALDDCPATRWLWLRPAMWKRGTGSGWAARGPAFHGILEPGEFAAGGDEGWTTTSRSGVATVAPITNLPSRLRRRSQDTHTILCRGGVSASLPGFRPTTDLGEATLAVARADYASFHELIGAQVPTVFVPSPEAPDDELARARFADAAGVSLCATDDEELSSALDRLADPQVRSSLRRRCAELAFGNGAADAALWLATHCRGRSEVEADLAGHR